MFSPEGILTKKFDKKMMGYDQVEVGNYLKMLSQEFEKLLIEKTELKEALRDKELALLEYKERDELLKSTIATATRMSDKIRQDSEREAKLIVGDANQQSDRIVRDAKDSLRKIYNEINDLKKIRMQFETSAKALFESHLNLLNQGRELIANPELDSFSFLENQDQDLSEKVSMAVDAALA